MITARDAIARLTSDSVMPPTPACTTVTFTSSVASRVSACTSASCEPCTSALMTRVRTFFALAHLLEHVLELGRLLLGELDVAELPLPEKRDLARLALVANDDRFLARGGHLGETLDLDRDGRSGRLTGLPFSSSIARTRPYTAPVRTMSPRCSVPDCTRSVATGPRPLSRRASITTPFAGASTGALSSSTSACSSTCSSRLVDALPGLRRHRDYRRVAAVFLGHYAVVQQLLLDLLRIGLVLVDLVHCHDQRHVRRLGVVDRLDRLRHDAVVGSDHENDDVRRLGAACAHRGEGFSPGVSRKVITPRGVSTW